MKTINIIGRDKKTSIEVTDSDYEKYSRYKWRLHPRGYLISTISGKSVTMKKEDGSPYRIKNTNYRPKYKEFELVDGYYCIYRVFNEYQVWVDYKDKKKFIGSYKQLSTAARVYNEICDTYYGEDAPLNQY